MSPKAKPFLPHVAEVYTQGGQQPRPQYEKHLGIDGGQSSFFFGISTGEHEKQDWKRAKVSTSLARIDQYQ